MMNLDEAKSERIDIRTTPSVKRTLQDAAAAKNKTVTEFMLDVALTEAAEQIANQRLFLLDDKQWAAFVSALDAPSKPKPRLETLLREPGVFEFVTAKDDDAQRFYEHYNFDPSPADPRQLFLVMKDLKGMI